MSIFFEDNKKCDYEIDQEIVEFDEKDEENRL